MQLNQVGHGFNHKLQQPMADIGDKIGSALCDMLKNSPLPLATGHEVIYLLAPNWPFSLNKSTNHHDYVREKPTYRSHDRGNHGNGVTMLTD